MSDNDKYGEPSSSIRTYTQLQFYPMAPRIEDIDILDIAHSLSNQCRYTGHTRDYYSVAEHSVRMSHIVSVPNQRWALMHDAAEAYLSDMARPVKQHFPLFHEKEEVLLELIAKKYNLSWPMPTEIDEADYIMISTEKRDLFDNAIQWTQLTDRPAPHSEVIIPWQPSVAFNEFTKRFKKLFGYVNDNRFTATRV